MPALALHLCHSNCQTLADALDQEWGVESEFSLNGLHLCVDVTEASSVNILLSADDATANQGPFKLLRKRTSSDPALRLSFRNCGLDPALPTRSGIFDLLLRDCDATFDMLTVMNLVNRMLGGVVTPLLTAATHPRPDVSNGTLHFPESDVFRAADSAPSTPSFVDVSVRLVNGIFLLPFQRHASETVNWSARCDEVILRMFWTVAGAVVDLTVSTFSVGNEHGAQLVEPQANSEASLRLKLLSPFKFADGPPRMDIDIPRVSLTLSPRDIIAAVDLLYNNVLRFPESTNDVTKRESQSTVITINVRTTQLKALSGQAEWCNLTATDLLVNVQGEMTELSLKRLEVYDLVDGVRMLEHIAEEEAEGDGHVLRVVLRSNETSVFVQGTHFELWMPAVYRLMSYGRRSAQVHIPGGSTEPKPKRVIVSWTKASLAATDAVGGMNCFRASLESVNVNSMESTMVQWKNLRVPGLLDCPGNGTLEIDATAARVRVGETTLTASRPSLSTLKAILYGNIMLPDVTENDVVTANTSTPAVTPRGLMLDMQRCLVHCGDAGAPESCFAQVALSTFHFESCGRDQRLSLGTVTAWNHRVSPPVQFIVCGDHDKQHQAFVFVKSSLESMLTIDDVSLAIDPIVVGKLVDMSLIFVDDVSRDAASPTTPRMSTTFTCVTRSVGFQLFSPENTAVCRGEIGTSRFSSDPGSSRIQVGDFSVSRQGSAKPTIFTSNNDAVKATVMTIDNSTCRDVGPKFVSSIEATLSAITVDVDLTLFQEIARSASHAASVMKNLEVVKKRASAETTKALNEVSDLTKVNITIDNPQVYWPLLPTDKRLLFRPGKLSIHNDLIGHSAEIPTEVFLIRLCDTTASIDDDVLFCSTRREDLLDCRVQFNLGEKQVKATDVKVSVPSMNAHLTPENYSLLLRHTAHSTSSANGQTAPAPSSAISNDLTPSKPQPTIDAPRSSLDIFADFAEVKVELPGGIVLAANGMALSIRRDVSGLVEQKLQFEDVMVHGKQECTPVVRLGKGSAVLVAPVSATDTLQTVCAELPHVVVLVTKDLVGRGVMHLWLPMREHFFAQKDPAPSMVLNSASPVMTLAHPQELSPASFLHVAITGDVRCMTLDLGGHTLTLVATIPCPPCIVLDDFCELRLTNGTLVVTDDSHEWSSFVAFGNGSTLVTEATCHVEYRSTMVRIVAPSTLTSVNASHHRRQVVRFQANIGATVTARAGDQNLTMRVSCEVVGSSVVDGDSLQQSGRIRVKELSAEDSVACQWLAPSSAEADFVRSSQGSRSITASVQPISIHLSQQLLNDASLIASELSVALAPAVPPPTLPVLERTKPQSGGKGPWRSKEGTPALAVMADVQCSTLDVVLSNSAAIQSRVLVQGIAAQISATGEISITASGKLYWLNDNISNWEPIVERCIVRLTSGTTKDAACPLGQVTISVDVESLLVAAHPRSVVAIQKLATSLFKVWTPAVSEVMSPTAASLSPEVSVTNCLDVEVKITDNERKVDSIIASGHTQQVALRTATACTLTVGDESVPLPLHRERISARLSRAICRVTRSKGCTSIFVEPIHATGAVISFTNSLDVPILLLGLGRMNPADVRYLPHLADLNSSVVVGEGSLLPLCEGDVRSVHDILECAASFPIADRRHFKIASQPGGMLGGVPRFDVTIGGGVKVRNNLTVPLRIDVVSQPGETVRVGPGGIGNIRSFGACGAEMIARLIVDETAVFESDPFECKLFDSKVAISLTTTDTPKRQMVVDVRLSSHEMSVSVPFIILNHTNVPITVLRRGDDRPELRNCFKLLPASQQPVSIYPVLDDDEETSTCFVKLAVADYVSADFVPLHVTGTVAPVELRNDRNDCMHLCYKTTFMSTDVGCRLITLVPRWVAVNRCPFPVTIAQEANGAGSSYINHVRIRDRSAMHLYCTEAQPSGEIAKMAISTDRQGTGNVFSHSFPIDILDKHVCLLRQHQESVPVEVVIVEGDISLFVVIQVPDLPPWLMINRCSAQVDVIDPASGERTLVPAFSLRPLVKDCRSPSVTVRCVALNAAFDVDLTSHSGAATSDGGFRAGVQRGAKGQVIVEIRAKRGDAVTHQKLPSQRDMKLRAVLRRVAISLCNDAAEILNFTLRDVVLDRVITGASERTRLAIHDFQVDNSTEDRPLYPVCAFFQRDQPQARCVTISAHRHLSDLPGMYLFDDVFCDVQPVIVKGGDVLVSRLLRTVAAVQSLTEAPVSFECATEESLALTCPSTSGEGFMTSTVIIDKIAINPLKLRIWFTRQREEDVVAKRVGGIVSFFAMSLEDVEVGAAGYVAERLDNRASVIVQQLADFYSRQIRTQVAALIFQYVSSVPLVGAPIRLFASVGKSTVKFFSDPVDGLAEGSPEAFVKALSNGTSNLVCSLVGGSLNVVRDAAKVGSRIAGITSDARPMVRGKAPGTIRGLLNGVTGLFTKPMKGLVERGAAGLAVGVGKGIVGVVADPVSGLLHDVATATGTIADVLNDRVVFTPNRVRQPREFDHLGGIAELGSVIELYEHERKIASSWSKTLLVSDGPDMRFGNNRRTKQELAAQFKLNPKDWQLSRAKGTLSGWTFSRNYDGPYFTAGDDEQSESQMSVETAFLRRRRWVLAIKQPATVEVLQHGDWSVISQRQTTQENENLHSSVCFTPTTPATSGAIVAAASNRSLAHFAACVEIYENERFFPIMGWGKRRLPTDRFHWSNRDGTVEESRDDSRRPPPGTTWVSEWYRTPNGETDRDGWEYAVDFPASYSPDSALKSVRRRLWRRLAAALSD